MGDFSVWEMRNDDDASQPSTYLAGKTGTNHMGHQVLEVWGTGETPETAILNAYTRAEDTGFRCFIKQ